MRFNFLKRLVDACYRLLGPAETAHLVDGVKSVGFLGYTDAFGEQWLQALTPLRRITGRRLSATERGVAAGAFRTND